MTTYYKFLNAVNTSPIARYNWPLPTDKKPGGWTPEITGKIVKCENGYHATTIQHATKYLNPNLYELEFDGDVVDAGDQVIGRKARLTRKVTAWNERALKLFAADCAEHVLHLFEDVFPNDGRPRQAIQAARDFANGKITSAAADAADAAFDAAYAAYTADTADTATAAAYAAAYAADTATAAAYAAAYAAYTADTAASAAAYAYAADAADAAKDERKWQAGRLAMYIHVELE